MAIFVCGLDETAGENDRDDFLMGGYLAPELDWSSLIAPKWEEQVLSGPPAIPYVHMTELRSPKWRAEFGLTRADADARLDLAAEIIERCSSLVPIGVDINSGDVRDILATFKVVHSKGGSAQMDPDYLCFMAFAYLALSFVSQSFPEAQKVDFIVERNGRITKFIQDFYAGFPESFAAIGKNDLVALMGELIPAGKDRVPLQAADILCWHTARSNRQSLNGDDYRRYAKLANRDGMRVKLTTEHLREIASAFLTPE